MEYGMIIAAKILIGIVVFKAIMGYRFPWETCKCCGQKIRNHN